MKLSAGFDQIIYSFYLDPGKVDKPLVDTMYSCFLRCLGEYTMDSRGDVGAWVREAAMTALQVKKINHTVSIASKTHTTKNYIYNKNFFITCFQVLTSLVVKQDPSILDQDVIKKMMADLSQQAVERIDRTRSHAGRVFSSLLHR